MWCGRCRPVALWTPQSCWDANAANQIELVLFELRVALIRSAMEVGLARAKRPLGLVLGFLHCFVRGLSAVSVVSAAQDLLGVDQIPRFAQDDSLSTASGIVLLLPAAEHLAAARAV